MEEGDVRVITFGNGMVVREKLVGIDDAARRVAYTVVGGGAAHHNASAQVMVGADGDEDERTHSRLPMTCARG